MNILFSFLGVVGVFVFLILLHEGGHYIAARCTGVAVQRIVLGLGKPIWLWQGRCGCAYGIAWLPLGGYIKLWDEREGPVPATYLPQAFNRQSVWRRAIVMLAGPFANLLGAWFFFFLVFNVGLPQARPIISDVIKDSPAAIAQVTVPSEIIAMNGTRVTSWQRVVQHLVTHMGEHGTLQLTVRNLKTNVEQIYPIALTQWELDPYRPQLLTALGLQIQQPLSVIENKQSLGAAVWYGNLEVWHWLRLQTIVLGKIIIGDIPLSMLGGPFTLIELTITAPQAGWWSLWYLLAVVSCFLSFANVLPLPGLDGGHVIFLLLEKIRGRPLSLALQILLWRLMVIVFIVLFIHVSINDMMRWLS